MWMVFGNFFGDFWRFLVKPLGITKVIFLGIWFCFSGGWPWMAMGSQSPRGTADFSSFSLSIGFFQVLGIFDP